MRFERITGLPLPSHPKFRVSGSHQCCFDVDVRRGCGGAWDEVLAVPFHVRITFSLSINQGCCKCFIGAINGFSFCFSFTFPSSRLLCSFHGSFSYFRALRKSWRCCALKENDTDAPEGMGSSFTTSGVDSTITALEFDFLHTDAKCPLISHLRHFLLRAVQLTRSRDFPPGCSDFPHHLHFAAMFSPIGTST